MMKFTAEWTFQLGLWGAVLLILLVVAYFVVRKFRDSAAGAMHEDIELLTDFREMKVQGDISDQEFRTIKSLLDAKPTSKVKGTQGDT